MKILFAIALVTISFNTIAQVNYDKGYYQLKVDKYNRKKTGGVVMIVAGTISAIVGISQLSTATTTYYSNVNGVSSGDPKAATGTLFTIAGLGLLGGGIPMTIIGSRKSKEYKRKLDGLALHLNINQQHQGLGFSYRF